MTERSAALYFPYVDILRGFAAVSVVVYHVIALLHWDAFPTSTPLVWFRTGGFGVDLFFVISGMVISLSAFSGIERDGAGFRLPFLLRRAARIVPLYYLTATLFLLAVAPEFMQRPDIVNQIVSHLLFFHNMSWLTHGGIDGPNWSVATEMQFYLLIAAFAPTLLRWRTWLVVPAMILIAWGWRWYSFIHYPVDAKLGPFLTFVYSTQLPGMLDEFAVGILLARFLRSAAGGRLLAFAGGRPWLMPPLCGTVLWLAFHVFWQIPDYWGDWRMVVFFKTLLSVAWALLVLTFCTFRGAALLRATAPLRYLGAVSYGIYLWHLLIVQPLQDVHGLTPAWGLVITLSATLVLSAMSWHLFERPIQRALADEGFVRRVGEFRPVKPNVQFAERK